MPGLTASLWMATQALMVQQGAISVTANNIANANTPGYSRQEVILSEGTPVMEGNLLYGNGVTLAGFQSIRDRLLELRIQQETQQQGYTDAQVSALQQVEALFSDSTSGIGARLSQFFNSLQTLSTSATSSASRSNVLSAAQNLATAFHDTVSKLSDIQTNLNMQVSQDVNKVNNLMQQIASLNGQVSQLKATGKEPGILEDQRTELMRQLAEIIDVTDVQTEQGDTLTTANGMGLVVGSKSFDLQSRTDASGQTHVYAQGQDITDQLHKAQLGGVIEVRDQFIPSVISQLDTLAKDLASAFNTAHAAGYDLSGVKGGDFFSGATGTQNAAAFNVLITDPSKIAASSDATAGTTGNIGNIANLIGVRDGALATSGLSPSAVYAGLVFLVGNTTSQAKSDQSIADLSLRQLQDQRNAVSGVSVDEETANLLRYQHAFQAAARIVSIISDLTQTIINIGGR